MAGWGAIPAAQCREAKTIPGSLDLGCGVSGNFVSILSRVGGSVADESASYSDTHDGSQLFPAAGLPRPRIINQPLME